MTNEILLIGSVFFIFFLLFYTEMIDLVNNYGKEHYLYERK